VALAAVVSILRETRARALGARSIAAEVSNRNNALLKDLRELKEKLAQQQVQAPERAEFLSDVSAQGVTAVEPNAERELMKVQDDHVVQQSPKGVGYQDVCRVIEETAEGERALPGAAQKIRFAFAGLDEPNSPALVSVELGELQSIVGSLVRHAVDSIGGGAGIVRIALRVSQTALILIVEDNGRGMSEELLKGLDPIAGDSAWAAASHQLRLSEIRKKIESASGQMEVNARLGVGSRVVVEFPRNDIFAQAVVRTPRSPRIRVSKPGLNPAAGSASQHA
jgi:signal transduction histidine kinase